MDSAQECGELRLKVPSVSSWLGLSGDQLSSGNQKPRSPPGGASLEEMFPSLSQFQGVRRLYARNQNQRPSIRTKDAPLASILLQETAKILGAGDKDQYVYLFLF